MIEEQVTEQQNKIYVGNGFDKGKFIKIIINVNKLKVIDNYSTILLAKREQLGDLGESHNLFYYNNKKTINETT